MKFQLGDYVFVEKTAEWPAQYGTVFDQDEDRVLVELDREFWGEGGEADSLRWCPKKAAKVVLHDH